MATSIALVPVGPTVTLSVANTAHAAVQVASQGGVQCSYASFLNTGSTTVAIQMTPGTNQGVPISVASVPAPVFPLDGAALPNLNQIILPASMTNPVVYATPLSPFNVAAIGSAAGPSIVYIQPVGGQS